MLPLPREPILTHVQCSSPIKIKAETSGFTIIGEQYVHLALLVNTHSFYLNDFHFACSAETPFENCDTK